MAQGRQAQAADQNRMKDFRWTTDHKVADVVLLRLSLASNVTSSRRISNMIARTRAMASAAGLEPAIFGFEIRRLAH